MSERTSPNRVSLINRLAALCAACLLAAVVLAQTAQLQRQPSRTSLAPAPSQLPRERAAELLQSAQAIAPGDAAAFFELGEDVADRAMQEDAIELRSLAVQLFVTAHEHALAQGGGSARSLRVSSLLALAEVLPTRADRERVRSLASLLDPAGAGKLLRSGGDDTTKGPQAQQSVDYLVALVLGSVRSGEGVRARQLLRRSDVRERLQSLDTLLSRAGVTGGVSRVLEEVQRWPCNVCGNSKLERGSRGAGEPRLCSNCQGVPGPKLSEKELLSWLRVEAQLLQLDNANWATQRELDRGESLAIIDDEDLPRWLGVASIVPVPVIAKPAGAPLATPTVLEPVAPTPDLQDPDMQDPGMQDPDAQTQSPGGN